ncbi:hypothetical protein HOT32_gp20 [Erwinia phage Faunus]|uniref:Uncharacterized protein n=1 Tax=Erwinia phage Faunus TaxID=2182346 RepID=A0A2U8UWQ8_9CAUD|nr:hypothetical protein HOT32_gp20 [Erwinia phage Faunus]AWN08603.1 hypothetical protein [Erwinia phage Faunus]
MEYKDIPAELKFHRERIQRCDRIINEMEQWRVDQKVLAYYSEITSDFHVKTCNEENLAILRLLRNNSVKRVQQLNRQNERLLKVSANFK